MYLLWKRRELACLSMNLDAPTTNYADILQRLVRRYMFKLERQKEEGRCCRCCSFVRSRKRLYRRA